MPARLAPTFHCFRDQTLEPLSGSFLYVPGALALDMAVMRMGALCARGRGRGRGRGRSWGQGRDRGWGRGWGQGVHLPPWALGPDTGGTQLYVEGGRRAE